MTWVARALHVCQRTKHSCVFCASWEWRASRFWRLGMALYVSRATNVLRAHRVVRGRMVRCVSWAVRAAYAYRMIQVLTAFEKL
jgi:hypothetical protein